ncbi:ribonuclease E/G [Bradyrhizobium sp. USDA 4506]
MSKLAAGRTEFSWLSNAMSWIEEQLKPGPTTKRTPSSEIQSTKPPSPSAVGNIYLAKVTRIEAALDGAYVEFGPERPGFLPFSDVHPDYYQLPTEQRRELAAHLSHDMLYELEAQFGDAIDDENERSAHRRFARVRKGLSIQDVIKRRQVMLVQVVKNDTEKKGAILSTFLSIEGKFLVLAPNTAIGLRVSTAIQSPEDRLRLEQLNVDVPTGMGVFVRSAARDVVEPEIVDEHQGHQ